MANSPTHLKYTTGHEWLDIDDNTARIGITAFAADALGDIVFIDLPEVGAAVTAGDTCGELESTKSVSDIYAPATGQILEVNHIAIDDPSIVNSDPFGDGWLFVMKVADTPELLDADAYDRGIQS